MESTPIIFPDDIPSKGFKDHHELYNFIFTNHLTDWDIPDGTPIGSGGLPLCKIPHFIHSSDIVLPLGCLDYADFDDKRGERFIIFVEIERPI